MTTPAPAALLVSLSELAIWPGIGMIPEDARDFASYVLEAASEKVRLAAAQPGWTADSVPRRAKQIAWHLAARTYLNPDSVLAEGGVGPLGGDRTVEDMARALHLTSAEAEELALLAPEGSTAAGGGGLWIQPIDGGTQVSDGTIYLTDSSGSDWMIPYLSEDDLPALG